MVPVAEGASYLPSIGRLVPHEQEFCSPEALLGLHVAEDLLTFLDGAEALDRIDRQASRRELAAKLSADIVTRLVDVLFPGPADTAVVMIELDIGVQELSMLLQLSRGIAVIERAEELGIQVGNGAMQGIR